jgi:hypothetical protein
MATVWADSTVFTYTPNSLHGSLQTVVMVTASGDPDLTKLIDGLAFV